MRFIIYLIAFLLLTSIGCDTIAQQDKGKTETPRLDLHAAVYMDQLKIIRRHIEAGSDLNIPEPSHGSSPLITAAALGKTEAAKILIDAGADLNYQNKDGSTALHTAAVFGYDDIALDLIDAGIDLDLRNNDGGTALHTASFLGRVEIVEALLVKGADKTIKNKSGHTAYDSVAGPFDDVEHIYSFVESQLKPLGFKLDYDHLREVRPKIAEMLK